MLKNVSTQDQIVITLSFNLSKGGVLKVYFEDLLITAKNNMFQMVSEPRKESFNIPI